jgi:IPT/TIG domain
MRAQRGAGFGVVSYIVMAVVVVIIIVAGLILVNVVTSSSSSPTPGAGESGGSGAVSSLACQDTEWFDASAQACVPRIACEAGQQYDDATNTCTTPLPTLKAIAPSSGLAKGGTEVRVTGTGFVDGASLLIDGVEASDATVVNDTTITATTPGSENLYPVDVEVVNPGSEPVRLDNAFVYVAPPVKRITALNPDRGSTSGGEAVIIKGVDFVEGTVVSFFGRPATDVEVLDDTTLRVITPAGPTGPVGVNVRNPGGAPYTLEDGFRYVDQPPRVVAAVRPTRGPQAGGTKVTITGSGFADGATVTFGKDSARRVTVESSTRITAVTPAGRLGRVPVGVRNPGLPAALLDDAFTYVAAPVITAVRPAKGPVDGGTKVTITGSGFGPDAVVGVGNVVIDDAKVVSESTITLVMPPAAKPIKVDVSVTNPGQPRALAKRAFTYTEGEPDPEPTPAPTAKPTPTKPALPRCPTFSAGNVTGEAGTDLALVQATLFPSSSGVSGPRLRDAGFQPNTGRVDGTILWQPAPPVIFWQTPAEAGRGGTIDYTYTASNCSGQGRGTVVVASR